jgi:Spy/CpxP family protein refolding chaperone
MKKAGNLSMLLVLALLSLGLVASAWAQPMGKGRGKGMGRGHAMMNLTPEQAGKLFDLKEKFHADTASLRKQMWVKRAEMAALWKAEKPDEKAIQAKQKEINAIREPLQQKMVTFRLEAKKISPDFGMGMGHGFGMGMGGSCGMGPGMGMGGPGMGMGPGPGMGMGGPGMPPPPPPGSAPPPAPPAPPAK